MSDFLDIPTPYLIGISTSTWSNICMRKWVELSDDTIAFDLDTGHFMNKSDLPPWPEPLFGILKSSLQEAFTN